MNIIVCEFAYLEEMWGSPITKPSAKGYPSFYDKMDYWVLFVGDTPIAYTGAYTLGDVVFVGNTYVRKEWRSKGLHRHLLTTRNEQLLPIPKLAILNPQEGVKTVQLESVVRSLGYRKVEEYDDVADCLHSWVYENISHHNIWRLDYDSGEREEE